MCDLGITAALSCLGVSPKAAYLCRAECLQQLAQAFHGLTNYSAIGRLDGYSWCSGCEEYSSASVQCSSFAVRN